MNDCHSKIRHDPFISCERHFSARLDADGLWVLFEGDPAEHLITWERAALMVRAMQGQTALYAECERERGANVMRELAGRESSKMKGKP